MEVPANVVSTVSHDDGASCLNAGDCEEAHFVVLKVKKAPLGHRKGLNLTLREIVGLRLRRKLAWLATAEIIEPPEYLAIRLTSAAVAKEEPMIPGRMTTTLTSIDRMFLKIRELIDTDDSIPLELRASLHTTLDKHLRLAKEGFFKAPARSQ